MIDSTEKLNPPNPPIRETRISWYKLDQHLNLNWYREILRNLGLFDLVDFGNVVVSVEYHSGVQLAICVLWMLLLVAACMLPIFKKSSRKADIYKWPCIKS